MKICPKCNTEHTKKGTFCSRQCANSRTWSEEDKLKKSDTLKKTIAENPPWFVKGLQAFLEGKIRFNETLKKYLVITREEKCEECNQLPVWNGKPLNLQVDHIDGDCKNNLPYNLRLICPNCHSQTDTFAGRNHKLMRV